LTQKEKQKVQILAVSIDRHKDSKNLTEASDPKVAKLLTNMMGSPVLTVPSLANASESMLANVYVFKNGVKGKRPFGFQP
jgi:hypothetical protein